MSLFYVYPVFHRDDVVKKKCCRKRGVWKKDKKEEWSYKGTGGSNLLPNVYVS